MARKVILDTQYTFTPSTRTLVINTRYIPQERLLLITNVTKNKVIYNFSDASLLATSYLTNMAGATGNTTIVLNYNTTSMSATDKIQIVVDEYSEAFRPEESFTDPVGKFRTSQPQALIDTDFEYGTQVSKWENLTMLNNRPLAYQTVPNISNLQSIYLATSTRNVVVNFTGSHYISAGTPLVIQDTYLSIANGNYIVDSTSTNSGSATSPAFAAITGSITAISSTGTAVTYSTSSTAGLVVGQTVTITGASSAGYNLTNAVITSIVTNTSFTVSSTATGSTSTASFSGSAWLSYTSRAANSTTVTQILDGNKTALYQGALYQGAAIGGAPTITYSGSAVTVVTTINHGLAIGNEVAITGVTTSGTNAPNGSFVVATVTSPTTFTVYAPNTPTGTLTSTSASLYVRPQGQFLHRPFDGGVIFSSNATSNFEQAIRQTRRYFRYQSGKGIQMSTGTILKPNLQIDSLTSSGTLVTVQTREQHNIQPGAQITILGANESAYNGTFTVSSVTGYNTLTYTANTVPSASPASGTYYLQVVSWYGASNRMGLFDQQNGMFWEFDGQTLYAVRRNSTFQLSGKVSVTNGSHTVSQTNSAYPTVFSKQLVPGDYIVLRGSSYRVTDILSDTTINISPAYRGTTDNYVITSKTIDLRIPQSQFNIDKLDGTGPSGYKIDLSRMQMWFIDYAWYGAGTIRYGVRGTDGNIIYCHKIPNNNVNSEAYLRSGNLAGRYESSTIPPTTYISASVAGSDTTISVADTSKFPSSGTLLIRNASTYEYVNYAGTTSTTFTGLTRGQAGNSSLAMTISAGSNQASVSSAAGLQVGQRIIAPLSFPDNTFISAISGTVLTLSQAALTSNPTVIAAPMASSSGQSFAYSATAPVAVEFAFPSYAPSISHWGTSAIMDGGFDDDKSLFFTYGQTTPVTIPANSTRSLLAIRVAPSVDNGIGAGFGQRELINRMQLILRQLDITTSTSGAQLLVRGYINANNFGGAQQILGQTVGTAISISTASSTGGVTTYTTGSTAHGLNVGDQVVISGMTTAGYNGTFVVATVPTSTTFTVASTVTGTPGTGTLVSYKPWTNATGNVYGVLTSSLAQIADFAPASTGGTAGAYVTSGGEVTGGFFVAATSSLDLSRLRDLGNSVVGGGGLGSPAYAGQNTYPDGPDVLTITVTNLSGSSSVSVLGRIAWTEAQA